ncbi:MAG: rhodanese-like domain-containing protein [Betaproteobacteria bacterium AqS2]|uniref:Rhodanese-like domain-containing protein n=1 Tax=Candidatus Amphirhobacter heronislandensis TaxID=1732024 RepID=A0A930UGY8_9GAMM|nr:rhodanese-like domain-containing protein [Betaproteobacteria bacterium AqS2]
MFAEFLLDNIVLAVGCGLLGGMTLYMWSQAGSSFALDVHAAVLRINQDNAQVIDLRSKEDFERGRLPGSRHVPAAEIAAKASALAGKRPLLLVCATGTISAAQARKLHAAGMKDVSTIKGGLRAWLDEGQPTHRGKKK